MNAALHGGHSDAIDIADHEISSVADGSAARKGGNFCVRDANSVPQFVGEATQARAEYQGDAGTKLRALQNGLGGVVGVKEFVEVCQSMFR
jgi:hypothetical protein